MKRWLKEYLSYNQNIFAWIGAILTAGILCSILFVNPRVGAADFGEYDQTLYRMGLSRTKEDEEHPENRYFTNVIEEYCIEEIDPNRLMGITPTESMIYPVTAVSMICSLLHMNFNTIYLAMCYCIVITFSVYVIVKSLYGYLGSRVVLLPILFGICILHSDNVTVLNSLYSDGMVLTSMFLFLASITHGIAADTKKRAGNIIYVLLSSYLFLTSNVSMPYLAGFVFVIILCVIIKNKSEKSKFTLFLIASFVGCIVLLGSCIRFICVNEILNSNINLYAATFHGAFENVEEKEKALKDWGLSEELAADIGKSFYLSEDSYVTAPYLEKANKEIYSHISYRKLWNYYRENPSIYFKIINKNLSIAKDPNRERYLYIDRERNSLNGIQVEKLGYFPLIKQLIAPANVTILIRYVCFSLLIIAGMWINLFLHKKSKVFCYIFCCMLFLCVGRVCVTAFVYGTFENFSTMLSYDFFFDFCFALMLCEGIEILYEINRFLNEKKEYESSEPGYVTVSGGPVDFMKKIKNALYEWCDTYIFSKRKYAVLLISILAFVAMTYVFFLPDRIGAYNNGDFGRMMDAMGLRYTDYDIIHQEEQCVTKVIENYVWKEQFDWTSITVCNPTMSQVFLAVLVKMTAGILGYQYHTAYATVLYLLLMSISFAGMAYGFYTIFGKKSLYLSSALILVLFGSYNLGWFNSLFSEATEMAGFLWVLGMSLVLIVKTRGTVRWYEWICLMAGIRFFTGAKSQVTPEIMFLGIWAVILAVYHFPRNDKEKRGAFAKGILQITCVLIMVGFLVRSAVIIYQKDGAISSQDTIYSSIFSGVLLVADDPLKALDELGLDRKLIADKGKNPYLGDGAYYCQPRTEMAERMIYTKVNTFDVLNWYIHHPDKLLIMLNHAAKESAARMPDYFLYVGEKTTQEHRTVSKLNLWCYLRQFMTPFRFWQYFILYGIAVLYNVNRIIRKKTNAETKILSAFMIIIVFMAALQFPLTVIGNGFIDNIKQLFMFRLIHDVIITVMLFMIAANSYTIIRKKQFVRKNNSQEKTCH